MHSRSIRGLFLLCTALSMFTGCPGADECTAVSCDAGTAGGLGGASGGGTARGTAGGSGLATQFDAGVDAGLVRDAGVAGTGPRNQPQTATYTNATAAAITINVVVDFFLATGIGNRSGPYILTTALTTP